MGGFAGIYSRETGLHDSDRDALGEGEILELERASFHVRPRSTLAQTARWVVAVAGHFDRAPMTGLSAAMTLLEAWEARGIDCLSAFEGAWVAVILERNTGRVHLLRDPFGIRRLYFVQKGQQIAFSTDPRTLLNLSFVSRELARENLAEYLSFRYVHAPRTLLRDVQALPAGHHLIFDGQLRMEPWFRLRYSPPFAAMPRDEEALGELERRLNRSVAARATSRERVGVFLSGGLDSSAISLYASRLGDIHTFTVGVQDAEGDETPYAGRVANILKTRHTVVRVDPRQFQDSLQTVIHGSDAPVTDPAAIPQYLLARAARGEVDVILAGDGGDEIFGGRMVGLLAQELRWSSRLHHLPTPLRMMVGRAMGRRRPELRDPTVPFGLARGIGGVRIFEREARATLMRDPGWVRAGIRRASLDPFYREVVTDPVNEILHVYLRGRMTEDALLRSGMVASLAGVGLREPLLDRDVVSFLASQPGPWKVRAGVSGAVTKWPLRQILKPTLTRLLLNRPKRVLPGPWARWFEGPLQPLLQERLALLQEDPLRLFLPGALQSLASRLSEPGVDAKLWTLFFLDAWIRDVRAT